MRNRDLFEDLKSIVRCEYISDMRYSPCIEQARNAITRMDLSKYSLFALNDAAEYLYAEKIFFINHRVAQEYFREKLNRIDLR